MARATVTASALVPEHELKAFSRVAGRLLFAQSPRGSGPQAARRRRGAGLEPLDHREYRPGDDLRWVDWRQTARLGRPIVRQFQAESSTDWIICLDASASMAVPGRATWLRAAQIATAAAFVLLDLGQRVALRLFAETITAACPPGRGAVHFARLARLLATHAPPRRGAASSLGSCSAGLTGRPSLFVISDFLAAGELRGELGRLARAAGQTQALQLLGAAQWRLPERGAVTLVDVESGAREAVLAGDAAERAAALEAAALTARLARFCATQNIGFSAADPALPWQQALLANLRLTAA
jgi:uncharacterized protein (DUF58 family)